MKRFYGLSAILTGLALSGCATTPEGALDRPMGDSAPADMASADRSPDAAASAPATSTTAATSGADPDASDAPAQSGTADSAPSDLPAFSTRQVARGRGYFREICLSCHESDEFEGRSFQRQWRRQTVRDMYTSIAYSMPDDNPGGLPGQTYADVIAYILELNGYEPGDTELTTDRTQMRAMRLWP